MAKLCKQDNKRKKKVLLDDRILFKMIKWHKKLYFMFEKGYFLLLLGVSVSQPKRAVLATKRKEWLRDLYRNITTLFSFAIPIGWSTHLWVHLNVIKI